MLRKSTLQVFSAWKAGRDCRPGAAIWTDGQTVYSHGTAIMRRNGGRIVLNVKRYSATTSNHQVSLRMLIDDLGDPAHFTEDPSDLF